MVTYLGSGIPILYHGPKTAAACQLLGEFDAGVLLTSSDPFVMASDLINIEQQSTQLVNNALRLAKAQFFMSDIKRSFWKVMSSHVSHPVCLNP
jgi:hypothetical protein